MDMQDVTPSQAIPGGYRIGAQELAVGDVIEYAIGYGLTIRALVEFDGQRYLAVASGDRVSPLAELLKAKFVRRPHRKAIAPR